MASPREGRADEARAHATQDEQLYAMEELAQITHFCGTFQAPLKLPVFSRTDLQAALVAGTSGDDRQVALLAELHFKLVREQGAKLERMIQDWEKAVTRKVTDNWRLEFSSNPFDGAAYDDLSVAQRVQVLNALCHWKLESCAEIQKFLSALQKEADPKALEALRSTPIGYDDAGAAYWYFGDCCWVYAEDRPEWQSNGHQEYIVEFADAKRIRLSVNFDPKRNNAPLIEESSATATDETVPVIQTNGEAATVAEPATRDKMEITTLVEEEIDEDEDHDEPLPTMSTDATPDKTDATDKQPVLADIPPQDEVKSQSRKMDITLLCGSPSTTESSPKPEPMEEDEHDVSEDRFMSTIVSTRDPVKVESLTEDAKTKSEPEDVKGESQPVDVKDEKMHSEREISGEEMEKIVEDELPEVKKRRLSDEEADMKKDVKPVDTEVAAPPKRRKTRFHDIIHASDNTIQPLVDKVVDSTVTVLKVETSQSAPKDPVKEPSFVKPAIETTAPEVVAQDQDFDIICEACQRSYDRRFLDPPLEHRPVGEWRCFECLVNDARGWPRRRNPPSKSPKGSKADATEESEDVPSQKKSSSSSKRSKSKSSSKKKSSTRSSSSSHKKGSSSKKSSKKHKKSSSSKSHGSSSSSRHHHSSRHKEEYAKLVKLAQGRKRERLAIEEERLTGAHLCPVSLDGPTGWRVVCCSVEGLRQVIEKLAGGSLEQDRLRGRLISILKVEEKMEIERLKKREQQMWQVLPRRQSSRVAISRIKTQNSGESAGDSEDDQEQHHSTPRSSRLRGTTNGHDGRERLARDRESRARRRRTDDDSESGSESDVDVGSRSVAGWINWKQVEGDSSLKVVCSGVIDRLLKEDISELFARPVDPEEDGCPDYLTVIQHPMDLGTIQKRVNASFYTAWDPFKTDVDRVWKNCRRYNSPDTVVVEYADALDEMFKQMRKEAERKGVRKMGKPGAGGDGSTAASTHADDDDEAVHDSSDDENIKDNSKSDSSASEVSSEESDESSEANSDDEDEARQSKRKTRARTSTKTKPSAGTSSRPSRTSRVLASSSTKRRSSRRKASDSEDEADSDSDSNDEEEVELDSDDSDEGGRGRSSRAHPRRAAQAPSRPSRTSSSPSVVTSKQTEESTAKPPPSRRNHIAESSDSSSSDESMKRDDSSSSSDSDDAEENEKAPTPAAVKASSSSDLPPSHVAAAAPPPPSTPPPPPPPASSATTPSSNRKPSASSRSRASPMGLLNPYQSPGSSSSYFSSSDSESSAGGSDSSDSE